MRYKCNQCKFETNNRQDFIEHEEMHEVDDDMDYEE